MSKIIMNMIALTWNWIDSAGSAEGKLKNYNKQRKKDWHSGKDQKHTRLIKKNSEKQWNQAHLKMGSWLYYKKCVQTLKRQPTWLSTRNNEKLIGFLFPHHLITLACAPLRGVWSMPAHLPHLFQLATFFSEQHNKSVCRYEALNPRNSLVLNKYDRYVTWTPALVKGTLCKI